MPGPKIVSYLARSAWVLLCNLVCIPTYLAWLSLLAPLTLLSPDFFNRAEQVLFSWLLSIVSSWSWSAGYQLAESGASLDQMQHKRLLILPNHQSTADVPLLMTIFSARIGFCNKVMWIMDSIFKFTNFGFCSWMHDDFFIKSGKAGRLTTLVDLKEHLIKVFLPKNRRYLVLFPEGGFLHKRKAISHQFAKKNDLPLLEHCTLPRTGALDVIMDVLGPWGNEDGDHKIDKIVDMTVAFPGGKPLDLQSIVTGWREPCVTHIHYREFDCSSLPSSSGELFNWMVRLYEEKEKMLDTYYKTGIFPHTMFDEKALPPKIIEQDPFRYLLLHVFFITSAAMFYTLFNNIYGLFVVDSINY